MDKVTAWERRDENNNWKHNHIEYGHSAIDKPSLKCVNPDQHKWKKELCYLTKDKRVTNYKKCK